MFKKDIEEIKDSVSALHNEHSRVYHENNTLDIRSENFGSNVVLAFLPSQLSKKLLVKVRKKYKDMKEHNLHRLWNTTSKVITTLAAHDNNGIRSAAKKLVIARDYFQNIHIVSDHVRIANLNLDLAKRNAVVHPDVSACVRYAIKFDDGISDLSEALAIIADNRAQYPGLLSPPEKHENKSNVLNENWGKQLGCVSLEDTVIQSLDNALCPLKLSKLSKFTIPMAELSDIVLLEEDRAAKLVFKCYNGLKEAAVATIPNEVNPNFRQALTECMETRPNTKNSIEECLLKGSPSKVFDPVEEMRRELYLWYVHIDRVMPPNLRLDM